MMVQTGAAEVILAGGAESMSGVELYSTSLRWGAKSGGAMLVDRLASIPHERRGQAPSGARGDARDS